MCFQALSAEEINRQRVLLKGSSWKLPGFLRAAQCWNMALSSFRTEIAQALFLWRVTVFYYIEEQSTSCVQQKCYLTNQPMLRDSGDVSTEAPLTQLLFTPVGSLSSCFLQMQISLAWRKTNNNRYLHKNSTALHKPSVTLDPSLAEVVPFMCKNAWFRLLEKAITLLQRTGPACQVALLLDIPAYAKNVQNVLWKLEDR